MSVLAGKELRIVGFLCNWCSYGGADTAGVARATQPTDLRIVRVPCSGRIDPLFILRALLHGADGVLVSGCHPGDCHYAEGNYYARRRLEILKQFLPVLGIDPRRFEYTWISASEGQRWQLAVTKFTQQIHELGKRDETADGVGDGGAAEQWAEKLKDADDDYFLRWGHGARRDDVGGIVEAVDVIEEQGDYDGDDG